MLDRIKGFLGDAQSGLGRFRNKQTAEALVGIICGAAHSDGSFGEAEHNKFKAALTVDPILTMFDSSMLIEKFEQLRKLCDYDLDTGLAACRKELTDIRNVSKEQKIAVMRGGVAVAKAEGEGNPKERIGPEERAFLELCAKDLGITLADVGL